MTPATALSEHDTLAQLRERIEPVALASEKRFPVPAALAGLFPLGGLPGGWSVGFSGPARLSLATSLMVGVLGDAHTDRWAALVGVEEFGLVAANELGLPLDRVLLVEHPPADAWSTVIAALAEAVTVIAVHPQAGSPFSPAHARRLVARAREQDAILFHLGGGARWPLPLDLHLTVTASRWEGLGAGHGRLLQRRVVVEATGRRSMARRSEAEILLPGPSGRLEPVTPVTAESGSL